MKIVFLSNKITPHQIPLAEAFYILTNHEFIFMETMEDSQELPTGWKADGQKYPFVLSHEYIQIHKMECMEILQKADIVICGSAPDRYIIERLKKRKLTFKYSERFYKNGLNHKNIFRALVGTWFHHGRFQKYPLYMLCSSAYTPADCAIFRNYSNRMYKWGYFPETKEYDDVDALLMSKRHKPKISILWTGRLIRWKHPDTSILLAERLKMSGYSFNLTIVGSGEMEAELKRIIQDRKLEDVVQMTGEKNPMDVRSYMEKADIFLFTSDYNEGWGAVLNEAMNSACAVVASHAIGSAPFLIKNSQNGVIYQNGNFEDFYHKVKLLIEQPEFRYNLGKEAYKSITNCWNANIAAERFIMLCDKLLKGSKEANFYEGPCSKAEVIKQRDMYEVLIKEEK